jgi:D-alanyl-D-alanine dipeptidase
MYAYGDNFTGKVLYTDIHRAYLHPKAAKALVDAQRFLRKEHPQWSLVIFDAARPMSVQQVMWDEVKRTPKRIYVSNPANGGGLHNYGLAVDVSICNAKGDTLSMGTKIDYMGSLAHITNEEQMMRAGKLTKTAIQNRKLLRRVMEAAGFRCLSTEWWHFNYVSRATARKYYKVIR